MIYTNNILQYVTEELLEHLTIYGARAVARDIFGITQSTSKKKDVLISEILAVISGELTPDYPSEKGRKPKDCGAKVFHDLISRLHPELVEDVEQSYLAGGVSGAGGAGGLGSGSSGFGNIGSAMGSSASGFSGGGFSGSGSSARDEMALAKPDFRSVNRPQDTSGWDKPCVLRDSAGEIAVSGIIEMVKCDKMGIFATLRRADLQEALSSCVSDVNILGGLIREYNLRGGDVVAGLAVVPKTKGFGMMRSIISVNGYKKGEMPPRFDSLQGVSPSEQIVLQGGEKRSGVSGKGIEKFTDAINAEYPFAYGQRGVIISSKKNAWENFKSFVSLIANSVNDDSKGGKASAKVDKKDDTKGNPKADNKSDTSGNIYVLFINTPTEYLDAFKKEVFASKVNIINTSFNETPKEYVRQSNLVLNYLKRKVEQGEKPILLVYNFAYYVRAASASALEVDQNGLLDSKKFLATALNVATAGALTTYLFSSEFVNNDKTILENLQDVANLTIVFNSENTLDTENSFSRFNIL
ncbi:MAG: hypothetical protein FWB72_03425 [Firmicutes bacterium]|nr:hypothetical protein [Bacillota bacterium]